MVEPTERSEPTRPIPTRVHPFVLSRFGERSHRRDGRPRRNVSQAGLARTSTTDAVSFHPQGTIIREHRLLCEKPEMRRR